MPVSIAVCIPSYNHVEFIDQCVNSALTLVPRPEEVIVRDDASSDGSWEHLATLANKVTLHRNDSNIGIGANYRCLVDDATTSHVVLLSSDDALHPSFSRIGGHRVGNARCLATGQFEFDSDSATLTRYSGSSYVIRRTDSPTRMVSYFSRGCGYSLPGTLWQREWLKGIPPLPRNAELATDWYWALFTSSYGRIKFDARPLHLYRYHSRNTSHSDPLRWQLSANHMLTYVLEKQILPAWTEPMIENARTRLSADTTTQDKRRLFLPLRQCIERIELRAMRRIYG